MSDLISRKSLLNKINAYVVGSQDKEFICKLIKEMPSVENKGEWKRISPAGIYECSCCGQYVLTSDIECYKFCHGCGAKMKGGE